MKLCHFYRTWAGLSLGEESRLPGWVKHHFGRCTACAAWLAREQELALHLRASAKREHAETPLFLAARVRARLQTGPEPYPSSVWSWMRLKPTAATVAGLALVLAAVVLIREKPAQPDNARVQRGLETDLLATLKPATANWEHWGEAAERSYEKELQLAMEDGRRALSSLIQHFAPAEAWLISVGQQGEPVSTPK